MNKNFVIFAICCILVSVGAFRLTSIQSLSHKLLKTEKSSIELSQAQKLTASPIKTHLSYLGLDYFYKTDQINRTLQKLHEGNNYSTQSIVNTRTFTIYEAKLTFTYIGQKQRAEMVGREIIVIEGDNATAQLQFNFVIKQGVKNVSIGVGFAQASLNDLIYAFELDLDDSGFLEFELLDYLIPKLSALNLINLTPEVSADERSQLIALLNTESAGIKNLIQDDLKKKFPLALSNVIKSNQPFSEALREIKYSWQPLWWKKPINYVFKKKPLFFDVEKTGILMGYTFGNVTSPYSPPIDIISGMQQFTPYSFYKDFLMDSIQKGAFDIVLDRDLWSSSNFKFYALDLNYFFTNIIPTFKGSEPVKISCKIIRDPNRVLVQYAKNSIWFTVEMDWQCTVNISQTKITELNLTLTANVEGIPQFSSMDFWISTFKYSWNYNDSFGFKIKNYLMANSIFNQVLSNIKSSRLIGSGFPFEVPYRNPTLMTHPDGTLLIDQDLSNLREN